MARIDPQILAHLEWLGFIQPTGLVVSAPALVRAGAILDRTDAEGQRLLRECIEEREFDAEEGPAPFIPDFRQFARTVLNWNFSPNGYAGTDEQPIPPELEVVLHDYGETLRPDVAVVELDPQAARMPWQLLVHTLEGGQDFDRIVSGHGKLEASPHGRMERLLRQTGVLAGVLFNGRSLRLISAPRGESSGWMDFRVADMVQTAGRPICTALRLLLRESRLLSLLRQNRFAALLESSRKFQNEVSERLAEQVLHALYELLRGFQAAHDASKGELLRDPLEEHPDQVYRALLTVILRLVFSLYAEERDMLPKDEIWLRHYSLAALYERLREDAALFPDTMDQRFGAWSQLLVLFRMIFDGAESEVLRLPSRHGVLFDPNRFPFLEGRSDPGGQIDDRIEAPLVPDGTIYRVLENLLLLDGERISYRALDVEQIGSVYETMMGFRLETTTGRSLAIRAAKKHGAPTAIDLEALLKETPAQRKKWVEKRIDRKLSVAVQEAVGSSESIAELHAALIPIVDKRATPDLATQGAMVLQPSEERRRSGSHYTPRELTAPIVRTTLEPILMDLRGPEDSVPTPEQILDLKVCDPAMGSGAFLVEACRQLGEALIESWDAHAERPEIPQDENEVIYARRLVAQRCLYGVDRNPVAVDLAKVSLWLVTLARDHALTFLDHALRPGDSLVGLSRPQIEAFHWDVSGAVLKGFGVREPLDRVLELRRQIRGADEMVSDRELRILWDEAQHELSNVRLLGDLILAAFFEGSKPKDKEERRDAYASSALTGDAEQYRKMLEQWRHAEKPLTPFHWEIEFPEVFERENPGFDAIAGNPPFAGKNTVASANVPSYPNWLKLIHEESHGNADLVAHFFRRAFNLLRDGGALGLIATNTIGQGDTRSTGLRWICKNGGSICGAHRRIKWPGTAAVVVSVIHIAKGTYAGPRTLDGREVDTISAFLFHAGGHDDPERLAANAERSFQGSIVLGMGFTFDDTDSKGVSTPLGEMQRLIEADPRNQEVIFPYIGGEEVNTNPTHSHHRHVINFKNYPLRRKDMGKTRWQEADENQCREWLRTGIVPLDYPDPVAADWPDLLEIIEEKVKPVRSALPPKNSWNRDVARRWWQFGADRRELPVVIAGLDRVLVISRVSEHAAFSFLVTGSVYSDRLVVVPLKTYAAFGALQSRPHETWARFFGSSLEDRLTYTPSDCFETFPFPEGWETHPALEAAGREYYEFRAALMVRNNEGLTKIYNRFHDREERDPEIATLRELYTAMDRSVLDAYGWTDIPTACTFLLDYEIEEERGNRKKPWRYRWPDVVRDEVLARLLELNAERARKEVRAGNLIGGRRKKVRKTKAKTPVGLF